MTAPNRPNSLLLVITIASLMFGCYGFFFHKPDGAKPPSGDDAESRERAKAGPARKSSREQGEGHTADRISKLADENKAASNAPPALPDDPPPDTAPETPSDDAALRMIKGENPSGWMIRGKGSISGLVIGVDGKPVEGVKVGVMANNIGYLCPNWSWPDEGGTFVASATTCLQALDAQTRVTKTGAGGRFVVDGLDEAQTYIVSLHSRGVYASERPVRTGDSVTLILGKRWLVRGHVKTSDGKSPGAFNVTIFNGAETNTWSETVVGSDTFEIPVDLKGQFRAGVSALGYANGIENRVDFTVGDDGANIEILLIPATTLSGVIKDAAGNPFVCAKVSLTNEQNKVFEEDTSDNGRYTFENLPAGLYTVNLSYYSVQVAAGEITITAGSNQRDFTLEAAQSCLVIHCRDERGQPLDIDSGNIYTIAGTYVSLANFPKRTLGEIKLYGLIQEGQYKIEVRLNGYFRTSTHEISLSEGSNNVTIIIPEPAYVSGAVGTGGTKRYRIEASRAGESHDRAANFARIGKDGRYQLGPIDPGEWTLTLYVDGDARPLSTQTLILASGVNQCDFLEPSGVSLKIMLLDENGNPITYGLGSVALSQLNAQSSYVYPKSDGSAVFELLKPGVYEVTVHPYWDQTYVDKSLIVTIGAEDAQATLVVRQSQCVRVAAASAKLPPELRANDLLLAFNGEQVLHAPGFRHLLESAKPESDITLTISRNGEEIAVTLKREALNSVTIENSLR